MQRWMTAGVLGLCAAYLLPGCEVGSLDDATPVGNGNFSGTYIGPSNGLMVAENSGSPVTSLVLNQFGNLLDAVDNNGMHFTGTIGDILTMSGNSADARASFVLNGKTTADKTVTINGTLSGSGSTAVMSGMWVEPDFYRSFYGVAGIKVIPPKGTLGISPNSMIVYDVTGPVTVKAVDGTTPYEWWLKGSTGPGILANAHGSISASSGPSVIYTRILAGDNYIVLRDLTGQTVTNYITQP